MIALLMLSAPMTVQPVSRPVANAAAPQVVAVNDVAVRKHRMMADAQVLLDRARSANARYVPRGSQPSKDELQAAIDKIESDKDSLSEMSESDQLELQMLMDRTSKMMSTLSNLLKKIGDTSGSVTNNIK